MGPLPPVDAVLRIALKYTLDADIDVINRFFASYSGAAPSTAELDTFCTTVGTGWADELADIAPTNLHLVEVTAEDLTSATAASGTATVSHAGTAGSVTDTAARCLIVKRLIARRYRGGHPRLYLPYGVGADTTTSQTWNPTFVTTAVAAWVSFMGVVTAAGWSGAGTISDVNVSYFEGYTNFTFPSGRVKAIPKLRATPLVDVVTGYSGNPNLASQRRRNQTP